jgi:hypothetical protein
MASRPNRRRRQSQLGKGSEIGEFHCHDMLGIHDHERLTNHLIAGGLTNPRLLNQEQSRPIREQTGRIGLNPAAHESRRIRFGRGRADGIRPQSNDPGLGVDEYGARRLPMGLGSKEFVEKGNLQGPPAFAKRRESVMAAALKR